MKKRYWIERINCYTIGFSLLLMLTLSVQASVVPFKMRLQTISYQGETYTAQVPEGYELELLNGELDGPRLFQFDTSNNLVIGSKGGYVYRLSPPYAQAEVLIELGDYPHSIAFRNNEILIARTSGVYHAPYSATKKRIKRRHLKLLAELPGGGGHNSRTVGVGPNGRIYASLGISGNCSDQFIGESYPFHLRRGGVMVLDESKGKPRWKSYASGLRNPVGFDWQPSTGMMYATNNGPDHHGYELPPEYFSRLEADSFHGMPWFQFDGKHVRRDKCISEAPPFPQSQVVEPVLTIPARSAPMGVAFVPENISGKSFGRIFEGDAIIAIHGSWATQPSGDFFGSRATRRQPKITIARFEQGKAQRMDDLITGFQAANGKRWGRPIGVQIGPDGALYFTSDGGSIEGLFRLKKKL